MEGLSLMGPTLSSFLAFEDFQEISVREYQTEGEWVPSLKTFPESLVLLVKASQMHYVCIGCV